MLNRIKQGFQLINLYLDFNNVNEKNYKTKVPAAANLTFRTLITEGLTNSEVSLFVEKLVVEHCKRQHFIPN